MIFLFVSSSDETYHCVTGGLKQLPGQLPAVELSTLPIILKVQPDASTLQFFLFFFLYLSLRMFCLLSSQKGKNVCFMCQPLGLFWSFGVMYAD